ncbi:hypothetical protein ASD46_25695 [Rhizobium sp. Root491]|nr:hypothetical protein ASD46_25695 [Rhizobium sp. Root491]
MNDEFPKDSRVLAATRALNLRHSAIDIKANLIRIGCDDFQASTAIEQAIAGIQERKAAAKKETRTWGQWSCCLAAPYWHWRSMQALEENCRVGGLDDWYSAMF